MRKIAAVLAVSLLALGSTSIYAQGVSEQQYQQMLQQMYGNGNNPMDHQIKQPKSTGGDLGSNAAADQMEMLKNMSNNIKKNSDSRKKKSQELIAQGKPKSAIVVKMNDPELLKQLLERAKEKDPRTIEVSISSPTWNYERDKYGNILNRWIKFNQIFRDKDTNKVYCAHASTAKQAFNGTGYDSYLNITLRPDHDYERFYVNDWDENK